MHKLKTACVGALLLLAGATVNAQPAGLGSVSFENSGAAAAQAPFARGLALLHNFEYARAAEAFRQAQSADPAFAMAYWGEAMTYNHTIWKDQDADRARSALSRLAPDAAARAAKARTPRERAYLGAVETLFGPGSKEERDLAYAAKMKALHAAFPEDVDGTAFYALSLLGTSHAGRDTATYMRSAALLEEVFPTNMRHPGVLHYLIHSYDDPVHAPLGLRAARLYGALAPDAPHALHMTSHIFIGMGMWDEVIAANRASSAAADRQAAEKGLPPAGCSHGREWLVYAYYQKNDEKAADAQRRACLADAREAVGTEAGEETVYPKWPSVVSYTDMLVRTMVETRRWPGEERLELPAKGYPRSLFALAYADALAAGPDQVALEASLAHLKELHATLGKKADSGSREVILAQVTGLLLLRKGKSDEGIEQLRRAAAMEQDLPFEFGPPAIEKPSFELLGDELLALGRRAEACRAYQAALTRTPGRRLTLTGLQQCGGAPAAS